MKELFDITFDPAKCRIELEELRALLESTTNLRERQEIQPFFRNRSQLTAFIGSFIPNIGPANRLAYEFQLFGDFTADIVVGNKQSAVYCLVELEDAGHDSVFKKIAGKSTTEWGRRFEHGFSQLVDWFYMLDDLKNSKKFAKQFSDGHTTFHGMLIIGRSSFLTDDDRLRLKWRMEKVIVNSNNVHCLTFDDLYQHLFWRISHYPQVSQLGPA